MTCARLRPSGHASAIAWRFWSTATRVGVCRGIRRHRGRFKDALAVARELERLNVYWMEEPLHRADLTGMRVARSHRCENRCRRDDPSTTRVARPDRRRLCGRAATRCRPGRRHHGAAAHRNHGAGTAYRVHAAHLDERHGCDGQRPSRSGPCRSPFLEYPFDPRIGAWSGATS